MDTGPVPPQIELSPALAEEIAALAKLHRRAGGPGLQVLTLLGTRAEGLLERLPEGVRGRLDRATEAALSAAMKAAQGSRGLVKDQPDWLNRAVTAALGAAGGFGGLPSAMAELPVTTTVLLRAIQGVAADEGFDPAEANVQFDSIRVFAAAGPLAEDDGADAAFLATRLTLTGTTMQALISSVAPRLAAALGQKLAAQTVPVLGAAAGAAVNYAYTSYYQDMARVHFRLRRLAIDEDRRPEDLAEALRAELTRKPLRKG
ncbi:MAG: EcsC family protein [Rhodobacteraceae bacterium]|nr:EcsC family protein [Paracoccaceae bacterium]MBR9819828.1 EcsC family protein [Paracoccaceae bacterium]